MFDDTGLHVSDPNSEIQTTIDNTGMYVKRRWNDTDLLKANADGVEAHDVTVRNYLQIGPARFEEFGDDGRVACFWTGS